MAWLLSLGICLDYQCSSSSSSIQDGEKHVLSNMTMFPFQNFSNKTKTRGQLCNALVGEWWMGAGSGFVSSVLCATYHRACIPTPAETQKQPQQVQVSHLGWFLLFQQHEIAAHYTAWIRVSGRIVFVCSCVRLRVQCL